VTRHNPALPLYTSEDAEAALKLLQVVPNDGQLIKVVKGISAEFRIAGHILGSSLVLVHLEHDQQTRSILFSGDLGKYDQPIIRDPVAPPACDYLVVESTYGDRIHDPEEPKIALERVIKNAALHNSEILIPAFAVGRAQELLYLIRELEDEQRVPVIPVILDSPMASSATKVYANRREEHDEEYVLASAGNANPMHTHSMTASTSKEESKRLNQEHGARVIISASGMMTGGRVLHHALRVIPDPNATIVFVGYQAAGTLGRRIADGEKEVKVLGQWVPVRCQSVKIGGFSAHADWQEVIRWLKDLPAPPLRVFVTHGEVGSANAMAQHIRQQFNWTVEVPEHGQRFELM
jgi:metallo-beta-lactamase family protein